MTTNPADPNPYDDDAELPTTDPGPAVPVPARSTTAGTADTGPPPGTTDSETGSDNGGEDAQSATSA
jgi:hypothetical protein